MSVPSLEISLAILLGSIAIDFLFGEPRKYVHPVTVIRKAGQALDPYLRSISDKQAGGFLYVVIISAMFGGSYMRSCMQLTLSQLHMSS